MAENIAQFSAGKLNALNHTESSFFQYAFYVQFL